MRLIAVLILATTLNQGSAFAEGTAVGPSNPNGGTVVCQPGSTCNINTGDGDTQGGTTGPRRTRNSYSGNGSCYTESGTSSPMYKCEYLDGQSADACQPPSNIIQMINIIAPMLQSGGNPREACAKIASLYGLASALEYSWAQKCYNAADRCSDECGRTLSAMTQHGNYCTNARPRYLGWKTETARYESCGENCVPPADPSKFTLDLCNFYSNTYECTCWLPDGRQADSQRMDCLDTTTLANQKTDIQARKTACSSDRSKSLIAMIEAGTMGLATYYNTQCALDHSNDPSGPPTGPTNPLNPLQCDTVEKRHTDENCMPYYCEDFLDNLTQPACSCELGRWWASPRCNCKHANDKNNPACKGVTVPIPTGTPYVPPKPIPTPPPLVGTKPTPSPVPNPNKPTPTLADDIDPGADQEYNPAGGAGGPPQKVDGMGAGSGGGVSSLGLGAGGSGGGGGPGEGPFKTDIDKGLSNTGGGSMAGGGGGYPGAPGGGGYGPDDKDKDKMDLSKFLPKMDKARGLAGEGDPSNGITGANGLSNFEKVTRKMNEKRPVLLP